MDHNRNNQIGETPEQNQKHPGKLLDEVQVALQAEFCVEFSKNQEPRVSQGVAKMLIPQVHMA